MNTTAPNKSKHSGDIDLIDTSIRLWKDKTIILITIVLCLTLGLLTHNYQSKKPDRYILSAKLTSSPDMSTSIHLTKIWTSAFSTNSELTFSSPLTKRYADHEFPYSPLSLLIRFSEFINSEKSKREFCDQTNCTEIIKKDLLSSKIKYPTNTKKEILKELTLNKTITLLPESSIGDHENALKMYTGWAKEKFHTIIEREVESLEPDTKPKIAKNLIEVQHSYKRLPRPTKLPLVIFISIFGGLIAGASISLIKSRITNRLNHH